MKRSKQDEAWSRCENRNRDKWEAEKPITGPEKAYGQYLRTCERIQGLATGWIAGVAWAKRQRNATKLKREPR